jgi:flagellar operon protein
MAEINGISVPFIPVTQAEDFGRNRIQSTGGGFDSIFRQELEKLSFSNHAIKRLESRNIQLSDGEIGKIQAAVERAEMKGSRDSLVMMNDTAFIVNIPNRTVITAMQVGGTEDNIFTNIDSVVFT